MTSLTLYPDVPCSYPNTVGATITTAVTNSPKVLAVFRNDSSVLSLRGVMQRLDFSIFNPSGDTLVTLQLVGGGTAVGGSWDSVGGYSQFDINTTATSFSGGTAALTTYDYVVLGNKTLPSSLAPLDAENLGLVLPQGMQFAIIAFTEEDETVDIAWSVNWLEKD
jgi:hypothetical protein